MNLTKEIIEKLIHEETHIYKYSFAQTSQIEYYYTEKFFNEDRSKATTSAAKIETDLYGTKHCLQIAIIHGVVMVDDEVYGYQRNDDLESPMFSELDNFYLSKEEAKEVYLESFGGEYVIELPDEHAFISLSPFFSQNNDENITNAVAEMNKHGKKAKIIKTPKGALK